MLPRRTQLHRTATLVASLLAPVILAACGAPPTEPTKVVWWSVFDDPGSFGELLKEYGDANNLDVELVPKSFNTYEQELVDALAAGRGPDIMSFHNTWLPEHIELLTPLPVAEDYASLEDDGQRQALEDRAAELPGLREYVDTYVDTVPADFVSDGRIYAMPEYVDSLALYYNEDLLASAGIVEPPRTWTEFSRDAAALTRLDDQGRVLRAGAAVGSARNINRSTDILTTLMLQNGAAAVDSTLQFAAFNRALQRADGTEANPGLDALEFYTDFANPTTPSYSWSLDQDVWYSLDSFAAGDVAMMINYSHQVPEVQAANAKLNFKVAPLPQRDDATFDITYANYWGLAVSRTSPVALEAWELINFLQRDDNVLAYLQATQRPPAKRSLIPAFENDLNLGVFADQAAVARSAYSPDLNLTETVFAAAIDDVNLGRRSAADALNVAASQVTERLQSRTFPPTGV